METRSLEDESGFTLPEVMIVIAVMGILAAIAVPSWFNVIEGRRVDSATNQLTADLRLAHTSATNRLDAAQIRFSSTGSASFTCGATAADYCLVRPTTGGGTETIARNFEDNVILNSPNLAPVGGLNAIEFSPYGSARAIGSLNPSAADNCPASTPPGGARLRVTVDGNPIHCVTFNEATARVKID